MCLHFTPRNSLADILYVGLVTAGVLEAIRTCSTITKQSETTLGENTKDPTTHRDSKRIGVEKLGQRPKMSSNGEPLGAGLHCIYTTLHEGYARLSMRLRTVQCYASDVNSGAKAMRNDIKGGSVYSMRHRSRLR